MNKIGQTITTGISKTKFGIKKYSPEIMIVAGVVGAVTSAVLACKATLKVQEVLEDSNDTVQTIKDVHDGVVEIDQEYTDDDYKKDLTIAYTQRCLNVAKLYAPSVALGALSIASIIGSHHILRKRNVALAAAYATVDKGFKEYRNRVVDRFGEAVDKELRYGIKAKKVEDTVTDENGKEKKVKREAKVAENCDDYSIIFQRGNSCWDRNVEFNKMFLNAQQALANDILRSRGHLFLDEVYEMLGIEATADAHVLGWEYRPNDKDYIGDGYVRFDITEIEADNGDGTLDPAFIIDFNYDGYILKTFDKKKKK